MDTVMGEESGEASARRIQVRFVTKLDEPLRVPPTAIAIPADLTRFGLSSLVNALLQSKNNGNSHKNTKLPQSISHNNQIIIIDSINPICFVLFVWTVCRWWLQTGAVWFPHRWRVHSDVARPVSARQGNLCGNHRQIIIWKLRESEYYGCEKLNESDTTSNGLYIGYC